MRKITFLFSFLFIVLGLSAQTNLVVNPSFEDGLTGWTKGPISGYADPAIITGGAQHGTKYAQYVATATTGFFQEIPVTAGKSYSLSFWYKATGDKTDGRIWSNFKDAGGAIIYLADPNTADPLRNNNGYLATTTEWTKHEIPFLVPANATMFQLAVRAYSGGTVAFDNFSLIEIGGTTPSINAAPETLSFTSTLNATTAAQVVSVTTANITTAPTYTVTGADAAQFAATGTLTASGGVISVVFTPTSEGTKTAVLEITGGGVTKVVNLSGVVQSASNPYSLDDSNPLTSLNEPFGAGTASLTLPSGWVTHSTQGDRNWETKAYMGNSYAQMTAHNGTGKYQTLLISPALNFDAIDKSAVKFDWNSGYANGAVLKVYVMSKDGTKTEVKSINDNVNTTGYGSGFTNVSLDLSAHSGVKFLVFEYNGEAGVATTTYQVDNVVATIKTGLLTNKFDALTIWTSPSKIHFNAYAGETVEVYNTVGQRIYNAVASEGENEINTGNKGVAIVKVGNRVGKVIL